MEIMHFTKTLAFHTGMSQWVRNQTLILGHCRIWLWSKQELHSYRSTAACQHENVQIFNTINEYIHVHAFAIGIKSWQHKMVQNSVPGTYNFHSCANVTLMYSVDQHVLVMFKASMSIELIPIVIRDHGNLHVVNFLGRSI